MLITMQESWARWCLAIVPELGRWGKEDQKSLGSNSKLEASLDYTRPCLQITASCTREANYELCMEAGHRRQLKTS